MRQLKFILSGGGTGGHIYPAIAIANEIKRRHPDADILFVGASDKMEMQKVPQAGFAIEGLWIAGLQRKLTLQNMMFPFKLISSLWKSRGIIKRFRPDVVIGTGGFASGPLLQVAGSAGIPTVIQEQNSYPGITNKILGRKANRICVAYDGLERFFPKERMVLTGNPVREDLLDIASKRVEAQAFFNLDPTKRTVLVLGGSLGARRINQLIATWVDGGLPEDVQLLWQCGKLYIDAYKRYESAQIHLMAFVDRMDLAYAAADIVVSRAGASSVSELCIVGKPVIFIPSPNVAEDHQAKNAMAIAEKGAAVVIRESELDVRFKGEMASLLSDEGRRQHLGESIKAMAKPGATRDIVDEIEKLIKA